MATESPVSISVERLRLFDACCDDFEAAFAAGQDPDIQQYLLPIENPDQRRRLLQLLLSLEIDLRLRRNEPLSCQHYAQRFPEYQEIVCTEFIRAGLPCEQDDVLSVSGSAFVERLIEMGIVPAAATEELASQHTVARPDDDSASIMAQLCMQNYLTQFQCARLERGSLASLRIGQYVLLDELGRGGMGHVFRARHVVMLREVAIKRLLPRFAVTPAAEVRFQREVQLLGKLSHPQIVSAYDAGMDAGMLYLVMELVQGQNLRDRVKRNGPLPVADVLAIARCAANGLTYAHARNVVHRDIKPSNLMLTSDGLLKVLDLGLANVLLEDEPIRDPRPDGGRSSTGAVGEDLTGSRLFLGTPGFAPPEQIVSPRSVDGRADVYSLGMTLCFLLTGKGPARAERPECPVAALREVRSDIPDRFAALIGQMTEYARDRRPAMEEVEQRIAQIDPGNLSFDNRAALIHDLPAQEPVLTQMQPEQQLTIGAGRRSRLRHVVWIMVAILAVAAVGLAAWASLMWSDARNAKLIAAMPLSIASPELPAEPPPYWDAPAAMLYVSQERNPPAVYRVRPDGTGFETLYSAGPTDGVFIHGMSADRVNKWLYVNGCSRIFRMRFDGTGREMICPPEFVGPGDVMTLYGSHLFFMDGDTSLRYFSISPESLQRPIAERKSHILIDSYSSQYKPLSAMVWDVVGKYFYLDAMDRENKVWLLRWRGDATRPEPLIQLESGTRDLQCDYRRRILYWTFSTHILKLDLTQDSFTPEILASPASKEIGHFAIDFARRRLYWTEVITGRVGELNMEDGTSRLILNDPERFDHLREVLIVPEVSLSDKAQDQVSSD